MCRVNNPIPLLTPQPDLQGPRCQSAGKEEPAAEALYRGQSGERPGSEGDRSAVYARLDYEQHH